MARRAAPVSGVILGLLVEGPACGYDLMAVLRQLLGPTWELPDSTVYGVLEKLEAKGLVRREPEAAHDPGVPRLPGRPGRARVVYHATPDAAREFDRWMDTPVHKEPLRTELLSRLAVARPHHAAALRKALKGHEQECLAKLAATSDHVFPRQDSFEEMIACMVEDGALEHLRAEIDWARNARERLAEFTEEKAGAR